VQTSFEPCSVALRAVEITDGLSEISFSAFPLLQH
jgi:hypothetical protein